MRKAFLILPALLLSLPLGAETLALPESTMPPKPPISLPAKGLSMAAVERDFGAPQKKHGAVGGGQPQHPPITRWDYEGYSVFFEKGTVIDAVVAGAPAPVANPERLTPAP
ncbi:MAG TPA: hypothetical protein VFV27_05495 [Nevskiaceae bacterium]|nr:hypothetical protein [Nevskiaceae bacterium]